MKRNEKMVAPTRIAECWRKFAKEFGIKKNIYALKHTGNGMALENGANIRDLQLQNRHSSLDQTQRYLDRFSRNVSEKFINSFPKL
jgi:integrase